jgi:gluconolactonase
VVISGIDGIPGGVRVDENGNLYIAAHGIAVYSPEGKLIHTIETHGNVSNLTFGEADLRTLFFTERRSVYRARVEVKGAVQY